MPVYKRPPDQGLASFPADDVQFPPVQPSFEAAKRSAGLASLAGTEQPDRVVPGVQDPMMLRAMGRANSPALYAQDPAALQAAGVQTSGASPLAALADVAKMTLMGRGGLGSLFKGKPTPPADPQAAIKALIEQAGGKFRGIQQGGREPLYVFDDLGTSHGSTFVQPASSLGSLEAIKKLMAAKQAAFDAAGGVDPQLAAIMARRPK